LELQNSQNSIKNWINKLAFWIRATDRKTEHGGESARDQRYLAGGDSSNELGPTKVTNSPSRID